MDRRKIYAGPIDFAKRDAPKWPKKDIKDARKSAAQMDINEIFARQIYGPIPLPPKSLTIKRSLIPRSRAERIEISIGDFTVNAALWLPDTTKPAPLITGLDFIGPVGILTTDEFPLDPNARIYSRPEYGAQNDQMTDTLRGTSAYRWPIELLVSRGYAVLTSCYGSWTPDCPDRWDKYGVFPHFKDECSKQSRTISLWAWAILRLIDCAELIPEIDASQTHAVGHSRLGKAALWATAHDDRIQSVFANQSGCFGAAPHLHPVGETPEQLVKSFPHWAVLKPNLENLDQHLLLGKIAPRRIYLGQAIDDLWADPIGSYMALRAAAANRSGVKNWPEPDEFLNNRSQFKCATSGFHLRTGGHDLLPYDWHRFLEFLQDQHSKTPT